MRTTAAALSVLLVVCVASRASAQDAGSAAIVGPPAPVPPAMVTRDASGNATMRTMRLTGPFQLDGRLDEPFYQEVPAVSDFIQQEPFEGQPAEEKTEVWVFFDNQYVYVAARNWETAPERRVVSDMQRDARNLYNNDHFGVLFDTFYDHRNGYYFYANAQGGMSDGEMINEAPNSNWNGLWEVRTASFDGGWTIEFRFPFRSMRFKERGTMWGINFRRVVRWRNEVSFLTAVPQSYGRRGLQTVSSAGTLVGIVAPRRTLNLDVKPYGLGANLTNLTAEPPISNEGKAEFGLDAKLGITQSIVADFTYNTDFAQVEDDEAQVNLTRFSVFFPEKREFFLEGQDYFQFGGGGGGFGGFGPSVTPVVFYSRRIGLEDGVAIPIFAGGRVLGRSRGFQVGALHIVTDGLPETASAAAVPVSQFTVLRVNRDVSSRSRIGAILTRRGSSDDAVGTNYAYGADASLVFSNEVSAQGYWAATRTTGVTLPDQQSYRGRFEWSADVAGVTAEHLYVGANFDPEIGFLRRSAFRRSYAQGRYSPRPQGIPGVRKIFFQGTADYYHDTAGQLESRSLEAQFKVEFVSTDQLTVEYSSAFERLGEPFSVATGVDIPAGAYTFGQGKVEYMLSPTRRVSGFLSVSHGQFYGGTITSAAWRGRLEFTSRVFAEPRISVSYVKGPYGHGSNNAVGSRLTFTLTPRMYVSSLVQYQSRSHSLTTNARLRWEYKPGSELFLVYSDGRGGDEDRFRSPIVNRSFVVKATRLFRW